MVRTFRTLFGFVCFTCRIGGRLGCFVCARLRRGGNVVYCKKENRLPLEEAAMRKYDTVLFDLDGTLLDTLPDLKSALNFALREAGYPTRTPEEIAALFMADRVAHNTDPVRGIKKMLSDGMDVICDRYYYSSLAYQGSVTDPDWVARINLDCPEIRKPDLCVFMDLDYAACCRRMERDRSFREIYETEDMLNAVRKRYFSAFERLKNRDNIVIVDAGRTVEEVAGDILAAVQAVL